MSYSIAKDNGTIEVRTNNQARLMIYWWDLTDKEKSNFDYLESEEDKSVANFIRYKNWIYDVSEFMHVTKDSPFYGKWDGYSNDSYFSGTLVRFDPDDSDRVIMASYYAQG